MQLKKKSEKKFDDLRKKTNHWASKGLPKKAEKRNVQIAGQAFGDVALEKKEDIQQRTQVKK